MMISHDDMDLVIKYSLRFGEIAVKKELISEHQLREALDEQMSNDPAARLRPHRLIGEILLEKGWMTFEQILVVLKELACNQKQQEIPH
jgi:hypothetical protein